MKTSKKKLKNGGVRYSSANLKNSKEREELFKEMKEFWVANPVEAGKISGYETYKLAIAGKLKGIKCPAHFPIAPHRLFAKIGWESYGESFGLWSKPELLLFMSTWFRRTAKLPRGGKIGYDEYRAGGFPELEKCPIYFPADPASFFSDSGWRGFEDSFGMPDRHAMLEEMRDFFANKVKLPYGGASGYEDYIQGLFPHLPPAPAHFPKQPHRYFAPLGWVSCGTTLGIKDRKRRPKLNDIWSFEEARKFARSLKLTGTGDWRRYRAGNLKGYEPRPLQLPSNPQAKYAKTGWNGYPDFLGYDAPSARFSGSRMPFAQARKFVRGLRFKDFNEYKAYAKGKLQGRPPRPKNLPRWPMAAYKDEWRGRKDFIGRY